MGIKINKPNAKEIIALISAVVTFLVALGLISACTNNLFKIKGQNNKIKYDQKQEQQINVDSIRTQFIKEWVKSAKELRDETNRQFNNNTNKLNSYNYGRNKSFQNRANKHGKQQLHDCLGKLQGNKQSLQNKRRGGKVCQTKALGINNVINICSSESSSKL